MQVAEIISHTNLNHELRSILDKPRNVTYDFIVIGFGELRKLSVQWRVDLAAVERAYALDWLLKGIFDHATLAPVLALRGAAALRYAHCADYPIAEEPAFLITQLLDEDARRDALIDALRTAADASGLKFSLVDHARGSAKVEYTGPLGRRSAAQPRLLLSFLAGQTRLDRARVPLIHPFSDACAATVSAVALEEIAAERIATLGGTPRARDVFDLWFMLTCAREQIDLPRARTLATEFAHAPNIMSMRANPAHRAALERTWDNALRRIPDHPAFVQVERELAEALGDQT